MQVGAAQLASARGVAAFAAGLAEALPAARSRLVVVSSVAGTFGAKAFGAYAAVREGLRNENQMMCWFVASPHLIINPSPRENSTGEN